MARREIGLKLVVVVDTTYTPEQLSALVDGYFADAKTKIRGIVRNKPITILEWHYHLSTGPVTEPEA